MAGGELGVGSASGLCGDDGDELKGASATIGGGGDKVGGGIGAAAGTEEALALAARASFIGFASIILLEASITDPTSKQTKQQKLGPKQLCKITIHTEA